LPYPAAAFFKTDITLEVNAKQGLSMPAILFALSCRILQNNGISLEANVNKNTNKNTSK